MSGMCDITMVVQYLYGWCSKGGKCKNVWKRSQFEIRTEAKSRINDVRKVLGEMKVFSRREI